MWFEFNVLFKYTLQKDHDGCQKYFNNIEDQAFLKIKGPRVHNWSAYISVNHTIES